MDAASASSKKGEYEALIFIVSAVLLSGRKADDVGYEPSVGSVGSFKKSGGSCNSSDWRTDGSLCNSSMNRVDLWLME